MNDNTMSVECLGLCIFVSCVPFYLTRGTRPPNIAPMFKIHESQIQNVSSFERS